MGSFHFSIPGIDAGETICYVEATMAREFDKIPDWGWRERKGDLQWIVQNLHVFWTMATAGLQEHGRGAIVVDTTSRPTGQGHPFGYFPQESAAQFGIADIDRMVREYDPESELVTVLLKPAGRTSTYRVWVGTHQRTVSA